MLATMKKMEQTWQYFERRISRIEIHYDRIKRFKVYEKKWHVRMWKTDWMKIGFTMR